MTLAAKQTTLPLENGDHLTCTEFERRYQAMPLLKKAELIEGVVYIGSPVRYTQHGKPHALVMTWLGVYAALTPGVEVGDHTTVRLDIDNELQPDALLRIESGTSRLDSAGYLTGPPELIVEIAASSASLDINVKRKVYQRNGVQEYLVWLTEEQTIGWFALVEDLYQPLVVDSQGIVSSRIFPGLTLNIPALLAEDAAQVLQTLQQQLNNPAHHDFIETLTQRKAP